MKYYLFFTTVIATATTLAGCVFGQDKMQPKHHKPLNKLNQKYAGVWSTKKDLFSNDGLNSNNFSIIGINKNKGYFFYKKTNNNCQYVTNAGGSVVISKGQLNAPGWLSRNGQRIIKEKYPIDKTPYKNSGIMIMQLDGNQFYKAKKAPFNFEEITDKLTANFCDKFEIK